MAPVQERIHDLEEAIEKLHRRIVLRGESLGDDSLALFVDVGQFAEIEGRNWQVVWGRRGTGKTHLLSAFHQDRAASSADSRELFLYFSLNEFTLSPPGVAPSDKTLALGYFEAFFKQFVETLVDSTAALMGQQRFVKMFRRDGAQARLRLAEDAAIRLLVTVNFGEVVPAFAKIEREQIHEEHRKSHAQLAAAATVDKQPSASITLGAGKAKESSDAARTVTHSEAAPNLPSAHRAIDELLDLLEIQHVTLLLDEWSMLDRTGTGDVQPIFADLLKRFFGQSDQFTVKIAANRFQTRFASRGHGLEMNADIFEGLNLDRPQLEQRQMVGFYREVLLRHLNEFADLEAYFKADGKAEDGWETQIFKTRAAFDELVRGAEGNPRNFLVMFVNLAKSRNFRLRPHWTIADVRKAIAGTSAERDEELDSRTRPWALLWGPIRTVVLATGQRQFYVKREDLEYVRQLLDDLLERRFVHDFPPASLRADVREQFHVYALDYGTWLDWTADLELTLEPESELESRILDLSDFRSATVQCVQCQHTFASDDPLYARRGLCPNRTCLAILRADLFHESPERQVGGQP